MKSADALLFAIPATYVITLAVLGPLGVDLPLALVLASVFASTFVVQALFLDPPSRN